MKSPGNLVLKKGVNPVWMSECNLCMVYSHALTFVYPEWQLLHGIKFKFIYSHLFSYNVTTIKNKKEVKTELTIHELNITKEKVSSSQRSRAFELAATTEQL